ncbi:unnamed protein product [Durusdinium trenchii]|uniref:Uncharacterized protein n=1 Tax=Durusdinium trenchii TaxID=1381693 RepID=A0ABP0JX33_9DINO
MGCAASVQTNTDFSRVCPCDEAACTTDRSSDRDTQCQPEPRPLSASAASEREVLRLFKIDLQIQEEDQLDLDDSDLAIYKSCEIPKQPAPRHQPLPPGREDHLANTRRVARFAALAVRHPRLFRERVGRAEEEE